MRPHAGETGVPSDKVFDATTEATDAASTAPGSFRCFRIEVVDGPDKGKRWESTGQKCSVGSHESNDLVLVDRTVSRFHCEIVLSPDGARIRDLESRNRTLVDGTHIADAFLRNGSVFRIGRSVCKFDFGDGHNQVALSPKAEFGSLVGSSVPMRMAFALLERAAATDVTVLIEGETGTGKEGAAASLHEASARADRPFVVVDCSAIAANLLESELFGHERGAFTGANDRRIGAFEEANTGTLFLDEIGELPLDLQPKLLRALEAREIKRVGSSTTQPVDIRVIAATNRHLRGEVNEGRFRADLYYRLAVLTIPLPPLRARPEDLAQLVESLLDSLGATPEGRARLTAPAFVESLRHAAWPGNVRELRNHLERSLVVEEAMGQLVQSNAVPTIDASLPYEEARRLAILAFERGYVVDALARADGQVAAAARAARMDRVYLHELMRRHGLKSRRGTTRKS